MDEESWIVWIIVLGIAILVLFLMDITTGNIKSTPNKDYFVHNVISTNAPVKTADITDYQYQALEPVKKLATSQVPPPQLRRQLKEQVQRPMKVKQPQPKFQLVPTQDDANYGKMFWTFGIVGNSKLDWSRPIREVVYTHIPVQPGSKQAACLIKPTGILYHKERLPLLSTGGHKAQVHFVHPAGYKVPVDAYIGVIDKEGSIGLAIDLRQSVMPTSWYKEGSFILFRGRDCSA